MQYASKSYIKDVFVELPDYQYKHHPLENEDSSYIGRKEIKNRVLDILKNSDTTRGAYLVTGFRGMGKSSFVSKVIDEYKKLRAGVNKKKVRKNDSKGNRDKKTRVKHIKVSLGKTNLKHNEILKQLIMSFKNDLMTKVERRIFTLEGHSAVLQFTIVIFFLFTTLILSKTGFHLFYPFFSFKKYISLDASWKVFILPLVYSYVIAFLLVIGIRINNSFIKSIGLFKKLNQLHMEAVSETVHEDSTTFLNALKTYFLPNGVLKKPPLSVKETENQLIYIINSSLSGNRNLINSEQEIPFGKILRSAKEWIEKNIYRQIDYEFIFTFDELDKLEANRYSDDYLQNEIGKRDDDSLRPSLDESRDKKQLMLILISTLKSLINEAHAKFFFIAGREMYESYLADISDRQSSIGSIFNTVIYCDSFLNDQLDSRGGLTHMYEYYLKKVLTPRKYLKSLLSESDYQYFKRKFKSEPFLKAYKWLLEKEYLEDKLRHDEIFKVIVALEHLITFLTYRSNGSPKNLVRLIESLIITEREHKFKRIRKPNSNWKGVSVSFKRIGGKPIKGNRRFLNLSYNNQYKHGFIHYLYAPYILKFSQKRNNNSDYLLVSTSYLMDHLLKFHLFAFSKRNLDLLPEILSVNNSPHLRALVQELLSLLKSNHLRNTETPLFELKFFNKITNEISYLCRLFESESAAFNFTLDENFGIKVHLRKKIRELRNVQQSVSHNNDYQFIHSVAALNNVLGDAQYFDQEYDDAIISYSEAVQSLRSYQPHKNINIELYLFTIELYLKIGLLNEKVSSHEYALSYYIQAMEATNLIFGMLNKGPNTSEPEKLTPASVIELFEVGSHSFIASLYVQEKFSFEGITIEKVRFIVTQITKITETIKSAGFLNDSHPCISNLNCNLSLLLFYKNMHGTFDETSVDYNIINELSISNVREDLELEALYKHSRFSILALSFLLQSLENLIYHYDNGSTRIFKTTSDYISAALYVLISKTSAAKNDVSTTILMANTLGRLGDILLTTLQFENKKVGAAKLFPNHLIDWLQTAIRESRVPPLESPLSKMQQIVCLYFLSSKFNSRARRYTSCGFQLKKILKVFSSFLSSQSEEEHTMICDKLETFVLKEIFINISNASGGTDRLQLLRFKDYFDEQSQFISQDLRDVFYKSMSNSSEIREALIFFAKVRVLFNKPLWEGKCEKNMDSFYQEQLLVSPFNTISSQWTRILELNLQVTINWQIINNYFEPGLFQLLNIQGHQTHKFHVVSQWLQRGYGCFVEWKGRAIYATVEAVTNSDFIQFLNSLYYLPAEYRARNMATTHEQARYLIQQLYELSCNSLFCLINAANVIQSYGTGYPTGFVLPADIYRRTGIWIQIYRLSLFLKSIFEPTQEAKPHSDDFLSSLLGKQNFITLEPLTYYQLSRDHYYKALAMHQGGDIQKEVLSDMYYLEDDFNDNLSHFTIALERQRINNGNIRTQINSIDEILQHSKLLTYSSYMAQKKLA